MVASLLRLAGLDWPVPDVSTLCRRQKTLAVQIPAGQPIGTVSGYGVSDTRRCHTAIIELYAVPIIADRKNGRLWKVPARRYVP